MSLAETQNTAGQPGGTAANMKDILETQRTAFLKKGSPSAEVRIDRLNRAIGLIVDHKDEIAEAISADFGHRSSHQSLFTDVASSIQPLKHARTNLKNWMKPSRRSAGFPMKLMGARARVEYQPLGVIGIISPWNFPVQLTFGPLADIFAAGNVAMIKPSEFTPATSELMKRMFATAFDETEVAVITGGPEVGAEFSSLAFDHLIFTGATSVAKHVMRAAAENLVPVTLELGGKSPVIVSETANIQTTANRVMFGKTLNAGQICLAPDYILVPEDKLEPFKAAAAKSVAKMYPTLKDNPDYTSIVNQRHFDRLNGYLDDAKAKGADVVELNPANEDFSQQPHHKIAPTLVINPTDDMAIMQDEIFGPLLPVKTYSRTDEVIGYVNDHPRPLGLYYFGEDPEEQRKVLDRTTSGGVSLNDVIMHVSADELPFGGVGPSGMGSYHGHDGFKNFSHAKAIYTAPRTEMIAMIRPPWGAKIEKLLKGQIKK